MDTSQNGKVEQMLDYDSRVADEPGITAEKTSYKASPNGLRSSPPLLSNQDAMGSDAPVINRDGEPSKSDSEAETIVLPGKDGHSPSKIRKSIKHEDSSDDENTLIASGPRRHSADAGKGYTNGPRLSSNANSSLGKRKRQKSGDNHGNSSGLSSVPTSPIATTLSSLSKPAASDSDISRSPSPEGRSAIRDKAKSADRVFHRRKRYDPDSGEEDDIEERPPVRQRLSGSRHDIPSRKETRSISPPLRGHQRSVSTQLPAKSSAGLGHKKKRIPAPLQSTEYQSDESSASASSFPRSARLRGVAAPHTGDSNMSPVKTASHKKHVNSSGQTQLQRACAGNKVDQLAQVMQRYEERPQDLNESDHAGNTPLHSASINGSVKIVKFLLGTGSCVVDPLNIQKDTPLHDSLENRHVDVVKLLLNAGADPRKPKGDGKDSLDIIAEKIEEDEDDEESLAEWAEMKKLILAAIKKQPAVRQDSEDERPEHGERGVSHATDSPRHTPPVHSSDFQGTQAGARRVGVSTSRQVKTRDGNLYQPMNLTELRKAARDGDNDTTARILEVMPNVNDPMTLWLSARGGHSDTMEFQLAMGKFDPDTPPIKGEEPGKNTPFLVAIGRGNHLNVLKLLLTHGVDPTRLHGPNNDKTYYDIARERKGPNWQEEVSLLKDAYESYKKSHRSSPSKPRSPGLRRDQREVDRDRRAVRKDESNRVHKRSNSDPKGKDSTSKGSHRRNSSSMDQSKDSQTIKRGPGRPRKEESTTNAATSDRESSPLVSSKTKFQSRKSESEFTVTSDTEVASKPRRKLVSGKEFRGEKQPEKHRRASIISNASNTSVIEKRERSESRSEKVDGKHSTNHSRGSLKPNDRDHRGDKVLVDKDRARSLKRDDSKDRLYAIRGESPAKRPRLSETPPRSVGQEVSQNSSKRRKIEDEPTATKHSTPSSSPEHQHKSKPTISREDSVSRAQTDSKPVNDPQRPNKPAQDQPSLSNDRGVKSTSRDVDGSGVKFSKAKQGDSADKENTPLPALDDTVEVQNPKPATKTADSEESRRKQDEEKNDVLHAEEVKQARLVKEQAAREEEARQAQAEAERKSREQQEEVEARNRAAEAQRLLYLEQEKSKREELEKRRLVAQEQARAEKARMEKLKREEYLAKLPFLLRWHELTEDIKTPVTASLFKNIPGYRYDTIKPEMTGAPNGKEQWMLNTHVAVLLGERDLQLTRYTAWERIPLNHAMKLGFWSTQNDWYTLRNFSLPRELRDYFPTGNLSPFTIVEQNKALFLDLDLFFVKVSEFLYVVPNFVHLRGIEMEVKYMELVLPNDKPGPSPPAKWKSDLDPNSPQCFAPRSRYYINGEFSRIGQLGQTRLLTKPPPGDDRVPRRGLVRAYPGDPDYEKICKQQGLLQFLPNDQISPISATNPQQAEADQPIQPLVNGFTPPESDMSHSANGGSPGIGLILEQATSIPPLVNGTSVHVQDGVASEQARNLS